MGHGCFLVEGHGPHRDAEAEQVLLLINSDPKEVPAQLQGIREAVAAEDQASSCTAALTRLYSVPRLRRAAFVGIMLMTAQQLLPRKAVRDELVWSVLTACAEALLCLAPWELYESDLTPKPIGLRVKAALDRGLQASPTHIWLCHLKVHYSEMGYAHCTRTARAL